MSRYEYTDSIRFDKSLSPDSPFPEWIQTDRLRLERLTPDIVSPQTLQDAYIENEGTDQYFTTRSGNGTSYSDVYRTYDIAQKSWEEGSDAIYAIFARNNHDFIGTAAFESVEFDKQRAQIGIWLCERVWGNGYSSERAEALMEVAFTHLDIQIIEVTVVPENKNSVRAVLKYMTTLGGSFNGRLRRATHTPTGEVHDVYKWSISIDEYADSDAEYTPLPDTPDA